ncbi:MAG: protein phosphatase 2C domain-containing protein, partial [Myxococcales bacterium]|nr:protein phosphatase 2C domain-containing protein [Myxococcales bacterium]
MKLSSAGRTHVGRRRPHNEDSFRLLREDHLFIVADGMGGHASGELASQMSVEAMTEFFRATAADPELTWPEKTNPDRSTAENRIAGGIQLGNRRIWERATREGQHRGMGTTVVAAWFDGTRLYIGHV